MLLFFNLFFLNYRFFVLLFFLRLFILRLRRRAGCLSCRRGRNAQHNLIFSRGSHFLLLRLFNDRRHFIFLHFHDRRQRNLLLFSQCLFDFFLRLFLINLLHLLLFRSRSRNRNRLYLLFFLLFFCHRFFGLFVFFLNGSSYGSISVCFASSSTDISSMSLRFGFYLRLWFLLLLLFLFFFWRLFLCFFLDYLSYLRGSLLSLGFSLRFSMLLFFLSSRLLLHHSSGLLLLHHSSGLLLLHHSSGLLLFLSNRLPSFFSSVLRLFLYRLLLHRSLFLIV